MRLNLRWPDDLSTQHSRLLVKVVKLSVLDIMMTIESKYGELSY